jgi:(2R)-sulfolactate sulfo-lyase subunit alpha
MAASIKAQVQGAQGPRREAYSLYAAAEAGRSATQKLGFQRRRPSPQRRKHMIQFLVHEQADNVGVATVDIKAGETVSGLYMDSQKKVKVKALQDIPLGHKIALTKFKKEDSVIKYGHDIGRIVADIKVGEHVHIHNLKTRRW